jgi:flagellar basal-body rod protein FlgG
MSLMGFFEVEMPDGSKAYTRDGAFTLGPDGYVSTRDGLKVQGGFVPIPQVTTSLAIGSKGMFA